MLALQRMLLAKAKEISEKEIQIEELQAKCDNMKMQQERLRQSKHLAEELSNARYKLNVKSNQLQVCN